METSGGGTQIRLCVKTRERSEEFLVDRALSIGQLKPLVATRFGAQMDQVCLVYAGSLLKDSHTLIGQDIRDGFAIHLVIRRILAQQQTAPTHHGDEEQFCRHRSRRQDQQTRFAGSNVASGRVPAFSELITLLLSNPTCIRALIRMDPRLDAYLDQHPEVTHAITNPNIMREYLQIASNPNMMREFMRSQDLSMRNLESTPGGYAALERLYHNLAEYEVEAGLQPFFGAPKDPEHLSNSWTIEGNFGLHAFSIIMQAVRALLNNSQILETVKKLASDSTLLQVAVRQTAALGDTNLTEYLRTELPQTAPTLDGHVGVEDRTDREPQLEPEPEDATDCKRDDDDKPKQPKQADHLPVEQRYRIQLGHLIDMGFTDQPAVLKALEHASGDINAAIDLLITNV